MKNRAVLRFAVLSSALLGLGACGPRNAVDAPASPYRAAALVTFRTTNAVDDAFAVPEIEAADWSHTAWMNVPASESMAVTAYTPSPTSAPPVVFLVRRTHRGLMISAMSLLSSTEPRPVETAPVQDTVPIPAWCESTSWIGAFFLEGVGPTPDQAVIVDYRGDSSTHRLVVEPERHTVRANVGFAVPDDRLSVREPRTRDMLVDLARGADEAFPLIVHTHSSGVMANAHGGAFSVWSTPHERLPESDWRAYFLSTIPGSYPRSDEGLRECE